MADLVIRGGTVVDGTGAPSRTADVVIDGDRIVEVSDGHYGGSATEDIDADGLLVTPGFVDIHTHYDGQVTWDPLLSPTCWHGVTTVVMGNCGVGFAPVAHDRHEWLIQLMEGVEDIPGAALSAGIKWGWETFPEYMDAVAAAPKLLDVGTQIPHGAVRAYVMGDRGADNEPATPTDIERMSVIVEEAIRAGALGFSTSRTIMHMAANGEPVPGTFAATDELFGIGEALTRAGAGVFELAPAGALGEDSLAADREMAWMRELGVRCGRPISFGLTQNATDPDEWRRMLDMAEAARLDGAMIWPQVHGRTVSLLLGLATVHPFAFCPSWGEIAVLGSVAEQAAVMRRPEVRERMLAEMTTADIGFLTFMKPSRIFALDDIPDYEPEPSQSFANRAEALGIDGWELLYDTISNGDGTELVNSPILNYVGGNMDPTFEMLSSPVSVFGLGDGGAHAGQTCDGSTTTSMLTYWARDRTRGPRLGVEQAVAKMTSATAALYGLGDRGRLAPGMMADVNLIDFDRLTLHKPTVAWDLPANARRLIQRADGYVSTIKSGVEIMADGEHTGELPGVLLRGAR